MIFILIFARGGRGAVDLEKNYLITCDHSINKVQVKLENTLDSPDLCSFHHFEFVGRGSDGRAPVNL